LRSLVNDACLRLKCSPPSLLKGVKGLVSWLKTPELIEKGILRAKYNLTVFKDGTIRFDCTNAPLTHFKPSEVRTSVEKLKRLGYITDSKGNPLTNPDQLCELKPQDLVIPKEAATYLLRIAKFVDELLEKVYGLPPYYKAEREEDLVGHLVIGLSPHTSVGVVGRIVGFTEANVCYAHPYWHAAKRRDCDGDEDAIMLALDVLINFSEDYLPSHIGGIMDAPLLITPIVNPMEIDEEAHNVDVCKQYPLILYQESTLEGYKSFPINVVDFVFQRLGSVNQYSLNAFTHPTSNIEAGNLESAYKKLGKMTDKLTAQILLSEKISVVDAGEVIKTILSTHLIPDMVGNLRSFLTQKFRCKRCNRKLRRIPLTARCPCGGELTLTVHKGNVDKYLKMAEELTKEFHVKGYYCERVLLTKREIEETFLEEEQKLLMDFI
jgi:DNA polymerase II large subunit